MQLRHRRKRNLATHDLIIITVPKYSREMAERAITLGRRQRNMGGTEVEIRWIRKENEKRQRKRCNGGVQGHGGIRYSQKLCTCFSFPLPLIDSFSIATD